MPLPSSVVEKLRRRHCEIGCLKVGDTTTLLANMTTILARELGLMCFVDVVPP